MSTVVGVCEVGEGRVTMAEISSLGDWWMAVPPEQVWWEMLGLGQVECEEPLKWASGEVWGS